MSRLNVVCTFIDLFYYAAAFEGYELNLNVLELLLIYF